MLLGRWLDALGIQAQDRLDGVVAGLADEYIGQPVKIDLGVDETDQEWSLIRRGREAQDMDDRWNAFVENQRLYLHRSWTGWGV
jgi:hypothetical protein